MQGLFFGMSQPQANAWVHRLTPLLNTALGHESQLPARKPRDLEAVPGECEGQALSADDEEEAETLQESSQR